MQNKINVAVNNESIACLIDCYNIDDGIDTFIFHGGGPSTKDDTAYLVPTLLDNHNNCIRMDFSGHGGSTGKITESSLAKRRTEAQAVINRYKSENKELTLIGTSMAGHIACSLVNDYKVDSLVLFCPAAYSIDAWNCRFDQGFTEIIRKQNSYYQNNIQELLQCYTGKIMLILPEYDEIIPKEINTIYISEVNKRPNSTVYYVKNCTHPIHRWLKNKEDEKQQLLQAFNSFLTTI